MSEPDTIVARRLDDGTVVQVMSDGTTRPMDDRTDWARMYAMTEEAIEANALSDPDDPPMTEEDLSRMRRAPNARAIRRGLGMTQEQFADRFRLSLGTLRNWERGARTPNGPARTLLRVIEREPEAVLRALDNPPLDRAAD